MRHIQSPQMVRAYAVRAYSQLVLMGDKLTFASNNNSNWKLEASFNRTANVVVVDLSSLCSVCLINSKLYWLHTAATFSTYSIAYYLPLSMGKQRESSRLSYAVPWRDCDFFFISSWWPITTAYHIHVLPLSRCVFVRATHLQFKLRSESPHVCLSS